MKALVVALRLYRCDGGTHCLQRSNASAANDTDAAGAATSAMLTAHCVKSGAETNAYVAGHSDHTYSLRPACGVGGNVLCADPATCNIEGHDGYLFNVYEDAKRIPLDWQACLTEQEARRLGGLTPGHGRARVPNA